MNNLIIIDKPAALHWLVEPAEAVLGQADYIVVGGISGTVFCPLRFTYPRGLRLVDYPLAQEPVYSPNPVYSWNLRRARDYVASGEAACLAALRAAPRVVYGGDWSPSAAYAAELVLRAAGRDLATVEALKIVASDDESVRHEAASPRAFKETDALRRYQRTKHYFDFNFNANSLAIFGALFQRLVNDGQTSIDPSRLRISKFGLLILLHLFRNGKKDTTQEELWTLMERWPGTGKYEVKCALGSDCSRMAILESLWGMDMLAGEGRLSARMELTPFGRAFASRVHPDCYDPDLPARLRLWGDAGLETSQKAIDRYLRSFFGRQRRFVR